ncbi:hypothetical protein [Mycobacterium sp. 23]|uniref:hypothetical protein n=1 Tax=Mycobacterium sp. 23 TaxID=3400424 RepID=UPI003AAA625E
MMIVKRLIIDWPAVKDTFWEGLAKYPPPEDRWRHIIEHAETASMDDVVADESLFASSDDPYEIALKLMVFGECQVVSGST